MILRFCRLFCVGLTLLHFSWAGPVQAQDARSQRIAQLQEEIRNLLEARAFVEDSISKVMSGQYLMAPFGAGASGSDFIPIPREQFQRAVATYVITGELTPTEAANITRKSVGMTRAFPQAAQRRIARIDFLLTRARGLLATLLRQQPPAPSHLNAGPMSEAPQ